MGWLENSPKLAFVIFEWSISYQIKDTDKISNCPLLSILKTIDLKNFFSIPVKAGKSPDPATGKGKFSKKWTMYKSRMMNKFKKKYYAKTANLLTGTYIYGLLKNQVVPCCSTLKVNKFRKQIMVSKLLPKNKPNSISWKITTSRLIQKESLCSFCKKIDSLLY